MAAPFNRPGGGAHPLDDYRIWFEHRSIHYEQHWRLYGEILRVHIKRSDIDASSHAKVEIFAPNERRWNRLCSINIQQLDCRIVTYMSKPLKDNEESMLCKACEELIAKARMLLTVTPAPGEQATGGLHAAQ